MTFWILSVALVCAVGLVVHWRWTRKFKTYSESARHELSRIAKEHSEKLAAIQAQYDTIFNSTEEGLLVLDPAGRVIMSNRAVKEMFGIDVDPKGKSLLEVLRFHELAQLLTRLEREERIAGFVLQLPGQAERVVEVNATISRTVSGERAATVLVFRDLSKLRRLERSASELIANVSHELRTPVSIIKGYVEALMGDAKNDPSKLERFLQTIERHVNRLTALIEDLLTSAELESGRAILSLNPVSIRSVVEDVIREMQTRAGERGITMIANVPDIMVTGDQDRLQQVFTNLVDNAIKYGKRNGTIKIGAIPLDENRVQAFVSDDGPGIPPDALTKIFDRFYRVDKSRSRDQGGTGLGLSIVRDIVRAHGGEVWAESKLGHGATFFFTLRRATAPQQKCTH